MRKSILIYFNSLKPAGGIERVISTLANKLIEFYDITILVNDEPISFYHFDDRIVFKSLKNNVQFDMTSKIKRILTAIKVLINHNVKLKNYLKKNTFDYYYLAHPLNVLEFYLARGVSKKDTIITEHGAPDAYNLIYKWIKKSLYSKSMIYIVPTKSDTSYYLNKGYPACYIPHFRSDLHYEKSKLNSNIAISIGRFTDVKQQIILLKLWDNLVNIRKIVDWKLYLIGNGELEFQFSEFIKDKNLNDHVFLIPPQSNVECFYKKASMFLLTSKSEGFGMVLLEAISFGLPCISFDCPSGPRDIIVDNFNGFLIPPNDSIAFEKAIIRVISNKNLMKQMGKNSADLSLQWDDEKLLNKWKIILNAN